MLESNFYQVYKDEGDGFMVLQLIAEDYQGYTPTLQELRAWVDLYDLTFPVLLDPNWQVGGPVGNGYIPFYWVVDQDRVIRRRSNYLATFHTIIRQLLGIP